MGSAIFIAVAVGIGIGIGEALKRALSPVFDRIQERAESLAKAAHLRRTGAHLSAILREVTSEISDTHSNIVFTPGVDNERAYVEWWPHGNDGDGVQLEVELRENRRRNRRYWVVPTRRGIGPSWSDAEHAKDATEAVYRIRRAIERAAPSNETEREPVSA